MARNPDPKHGRWILPLIITAMVMLTFTFVNNLDPAADIAGTTTVPEPPFPTTPTSTTTTVPLAFQELDVTLVGLESSLGEFVNQVNAVNEDWDADRATFGETRSGFLAIGESIQAWEERVTDPDGYPEEITEEFVQFIEAAEDLAPGIADIVAGLEAPDDGTLRRAAVAKFDAEVQEVLDAIEAMREAGEAELGGSTTTVATDA